jgi:hypothetical protein
MENMMDENMDQMEKKMDELKISILKTLDGRLPKSDIVTKETHENNGSIHVENDSSNNKFSRRLKSNSGVNYGWAQKGVSLPKVELKKFDGTKFFTWENQIEKYFELHNIMDDKKIISLETLHFEIKTYEWYQWVLKRKPHSYH